MSFCKNTANDELKLLKAEQGVYTLLGLCQKSGRLTGGGDAVIKVLTAGQVRVLLVAEDLSDNSRKKLKIALSQLSGKAAKQLKIWQFGTKESLGLSAGKPPRGIWAVCDENFADGIAKKLDLLVAAERAVALSLELK